MFMIFAIVVIIVCHFEVRCQWSDSQGLRRRDGAPPIVRVATGADRYAQLRSLPSQLDEFDA